VYFIISHYDKSDLNRVKYLGANHDPKRIVRTNIAGGAHTLVVAAPVAEYPSTACPSGAIAGGTIGSSTPRKVSVSIITSFSV